MLMKVDRQVSQFKGRMLKGKVGGGEVRTQRLLHDEGDAYATGGGGAGDDKHTLSSVQVTIS